MIDTQLNENQFGCIIDNCNLGEPHNVAQVFLDTYGAEVKYHSDVVDRVTKSTQEIPWEFAELPKDPGWWVVAEATARSLVLSHSDTKVMRYLYDYATNEHVFVWCESRMYNVHTYEPHARVYFEDTTTHRVPDKDTPLADNHPETLEFRKSLTVQYNDILHKIIDTPTRTLHTLYSLPAENHSTKAFGSRAYMTEYKINRQDLLLFTKGHLANIELALHSMEESVAQLAHKESIEKILAQDEV